MSILVATAYMEEAERFDWLVAMDAGRVLATGTPAELKAATDVRRSKNVSSHCCPSKDGGHRGFVAPPPLKIEAANRSSWRTI